jgi:TolB protein
MRSTVLEGLALAAGLLAAVRSADADDVRPLFARPHEAIAYEQPRAPRSDDHAIRVMRPNGTSVRTIVPAAFGVSSPAWSPDGRKLAYESSSPLGFYVLDLASGRSIRIGDGVGHPAWSPNGRWIAGSSLSSRGIAVIRPDGTGMRLVTHPEKLESDSFPTWPPDSRFLAFTRTFGRCCPDVQGDIYRVALTGRSLKKLTDAPEDEYTPAWSPCGGAIAYVAERPGTLSTDDRFPLIWLMNADGSQKRVIVASDRQDETAPEWSPDCQWIAFVRGLTFDESTETEIYAVRPDGSDYRRITRNGLYEADPAWITRHG